MDDLAIVELYHRREERAIDETDKKYGGLCRSIALRLLGIREDVEECVNDTWYAAWDKMPPERPQSLGAFLGRITRNLSVSRWRQSRAQKRYSGMEVLLSDGQVLDFLRNTVFSTDPIEWENSKRLFVNKAIPKFDVSSQFDLTEGLQALGITDVFDETVSDFTPMTTDVDVPIAVGQVNHAARVMIDEEGCTATAFTELPAAGAAPPPDDEVDFVLDRPFLFCITGISGLPLFVGVVNQP